MRPTLNPCALATLDGGMETLGPARELLSSMDVLAGSPR